MLINAPGNPVPKARARVAVRNGRAFAYTPKKTADYESLIKARASEVCVSPIAEPVRLIVRFYMPIPQSWPKKQREAALSGSMMHTKKPDIDNLIKSVCDALNGIAYIDDSQIVSIEASKCYSNNPGTEIEIQPAK